MRAMPPMTWLAKGLRTGASHAAARSPVLALEVGARGVGLTHTI